MIKTDVAERHEIPDAPEIIHACYEGKSDDVKRLLDNGADINSVDSRDNLTCLHIACGRVQGRGRHELHL
jgi:ankyrin repeat protein